MVEEDVRAGRGLDEVDFRLGWRFVVPFLWKIASLEAERDERRVCIRGWLTPKGLVDVFDCLEKENGDGVVDRGRIVRPTSLEVYIPRPRMGAEEMQPPLILQHTPFPSPSVRIITLIFHDIRSPLRSVTHHGGGERGGLSGGRYRCRTS